MVYVVSYGSDYVWFIVGGSMLFGQYVFREYCGVVRIWREYSRNLLMMSSASPLCKGFLSFFLRTPLRKYSSMDGRMALLSQ